MQPVILAVTRSRLAATVGYDEIIKSSTETLFESATPDHSIYIYVYGLDTNFSVKTEGARGLTLAILNTQNRNDILPPLGIPGLGGVKELEVRIPASQALRRLIGAHRYGPVLFTKIAVVDAKNGASAPWPLCILLNVPTILGVTTEQVQSGSSTKPADVYADLLKKNLANLVKGTSPGHIRHGSAAEDPPPDIYIYGCNFDFTNMQVKPADIPTLNSLRVNRRSCRTICTVEFDFSIGPLQKNFQFELQQIGVSLPTIADLQNSPNYLRNAVLMAFGVQVANGRAGGDESNVWQWPMWLPMPGINAVEPDKKGYGNGQHLGNETSPNDRGEVRWYLANPFNEQRKPLDKYVQGVAGDLQKIARIPFDELSQVWSFEAALKDKKTIVLPKNVADTLSAIRDAGELCEVDHARPNTWTDDTVFFRPPFEKCYRDACGYEYDPEQGDPDRGVPPWTPFAYLPAGWVCPLCKHDPSQFTETDDRRYHDKGFAVVWRGDIPSLPLPINLIEYVKDLARRLWRPVIGNGVPDFTVPIPIPAAKVVQVGVERLEDVANELLGYINTVDKNGFGLDVRFAFLTKSLDAGNFRSPQGGPPEICTAADKASCFDKALEPTKTGIGGKLIEFLYNPLEGDFDLQLHIFIQGKLSLFGQVVDIPAMDFPIGPSMRFHPEPFELPTAAIFFQTPDYGGAALVALEPKWLGGEKVHIDVNTPAALNQLRVQFIDALSRAKDVLNVVRFFTLYGIPCLDQITNVIGNICFIGRSVIDSNGTIENVTDCVIANNFLGQIFGNSTFNDDISSVVMIGPPHSSSRTVIKCWEHSLRRRPELGRCLRLEMPDGQFVFTIPNFAQISRSCFDQSTLDPTPPVQAVIDFDNKVTGIEFVVE